MPHVNHYGSLSRLTAQSSLLLSMALLITLAPGWSPSAQAQTYQLIHSFNGNSGDTYEPLAGLSMDARGNLYGTTYFAGDHGTGSGSVFELSPKGFRLDLRTAACLPRAWR